MAVPGIGLMKRNRKAMFFTLLSVLFVSVIVLTFSGDASVKLRDRSPVIKSRVLAANSYFKELKENTAERFLRVSSYNALYALAYFCEVKPGLFSSYREFSGNFSNVTISGMVYIPQEGWMPIDDYIDEPIMEGRTLNELFSNMGSMVEQTMHIRTAVTVNWMNISQSNATGPWDVNVIANMTFFVDAGIANWTSDSMVSTTFSIIGLEDPLVLLNSSGAEARVINNTIGSNTTDNLEGRWNRAYLIEMINYRSYRKEPTAPSYIMRFYNDLSASDCCGIESMIDEDIQIHDGSFPPIYLKRSYADYCYYGSTACDQGMLCNITGITTDAFQFQLETAHMSSYNVMEYAKCS